MNQKAAVFVTGATSGIGAACARQFAQKKYPVVLNGRRLDRLLQMEKELGAHTEIFLAPFDVTDRDQMQEWFQKNAALTARVGILVNNAGLARGSDPVQTADEKDWEEMIDTNVTALFSMTKKFVPQFVKNRSGHVINIGSVAGRWAYPGGAVYCATKFAVRAFSEGLRMDVASSGVRVTNIEPGMVETEFSEVRFRDSDKAKKVYEGMQPLTAENIADSVVWAAEQPLHVNIQELVIFPTAQGSIRDVHRV